MNPSISVIIPAHNEEKYLGNTLTALKAQTYPHFEVIVVCNGCTDNTREIASAQADRTIVLDEKALSRARNAGGAKARGDLLIFLDADTLLEPNALEIVAREFSPECAAGTLKGRPDSNRKRHRVMYFFKNLLHRTHLHCGSSGVILCWKDGFKCAGGFDEQLHVRENSDFIRRLLTYGKYKYIYSTPATTSMRRYEKRGFFRMVMHWLKIWMLCRLSDLKNRTYDVVR